MRCVFSACRGSWVTITTVVCSSRLEPREQRHDLVAHLASRGCRSARRRAGCAGCPTIARATATRCCWPPDSCDGKWCTRELEPDLVERRQRQLPPLAGRHAAVQQRQLHVVDDRQIGNQVERLEDESELAIAHARERAVASTT